MRYSHLSQRSDSDPHVVYIENSWTSRSVNKKFSELQNELWLTARLCRAVNHAHSKRDEFLIHRPTGPEIVYMPQGLNKQKNNLQQRLVSMVSLITVGHHSVLAHIDSNKSVVKKSSFFRVFLFIKLTKNLIIYEHRHTRAHTNIRFFHIIKNRFLSN